HTPELGVENAEGDSQAKEEQGNDDAPDALHLAIGKQHDGREHGGAGQNPGEFSGNGTQHGVERREVPDRGNVRRSLERVGRDEVVELQEVAAHFRREEHDGREDNLEARHTHDVVHRVVGVEGDAVDGVAVGVFGAFLDFNAVGVVGTHFV